MKKLHKLVITSFAGPFIMTFFIAQFILLMQFLWKYIDDLVGKGLDTLVIAELLFYTSANLVPLALPLAILVSSIMTFGNLAEHYEITAAKASGISLQKLMRPLFATAILISLSAFFFSNNILPYTNLKMGSLLYDIRQQKPALSIREGVFYNGIDGYSIKVGDKDRDGKTIRNVMIYDHTQSGGNKKVIIAESGTMTTTSDDRFLVVNLFNGSSYEEQDKHKNGFNSHPLMRNGFKTYKILFDLSQFKLSRTNEEMFHGGYQMMNLSQLSDAIDSVSSTYEIKKKQITGNMKPYYFFLRDSAFFAKVNSAASVTFQTAQTLPGKSPYSIAQNASRQIKSYSSSSYDELDNWEYIVAKHKVEWHRKLSLSTACFILFLIGAPLGAIIRKGGMGLPLVISVIFFLLYHIASITGEKLAKEGEILPVQGMWFSSAILLPVGLFLIYKATHDSVIFDAELYKSVFKKLRLKKVKILQLCPRIPYPPVDGGTIGMYNLSTSLLNLGAEVKVLAFNTRKHFLATDKINKKYSESHKLEWVYLDNSLKPAKALMNIFSNRSYNITRFYSKEFSSKLRKVLQEESFDIVQIDYLTMTLYINDIREVSDAKIVLRAHNVEHRIWKRLAAEEKNPLKKWYLKLLAAQLYTYEKQVLSDIDALVTLTEEETAVFTEMGNKVPVCIAPTCFSVDEMQVYEKQDSFSLFHLGAMDWRPNQEGMEWFLTQVWPRIQDRFPEVKLYIAGNNMPERFFNFNNENCKVEGRVPDAREYMQNHSVMIVPLLAGSGIRVKIVEGMALGKVIISTSQGAEGLHYQHMKNIIIADTEQQMVDAVDLCYSNPGLIIEIGRNARELAENYYDMKKVGRRVFEFYSGIAEKVMSYKT